MDELIQELKAQRESLGLSIQDLFQRTRINSDFMDALEAGNFDVLPEAYVKLFLKRYAQEVKLDGDEIVRRFEQHQWKTEAATEQFTHSTSDVTPGWVIGIGGAAVLAIVAAVIVWQSNTAEPPSRVTAALEQSTIPPQQTARQPTPHSAAPRETSSPPPAVEVRSTSSVWTDEPLPEKATPASQPDSEPLDPPEPIAQSSQDSSKPEDLPNLGDAEDPISENPSDDQTESTDQAIVEPEENSPSEGPAPEDEGKSERVVSAYSLSLSQGLTEAEDGLSLTATSLRPTEVAVTSDGKPIFGDTVEAGRRESWDARDRFLIEIQNGSDIRLQLQGVDLPTIGADGRKVRLFISRSSIWIEEIESPEIASSTSPP